MTNSLPAKTTDQLDLITGVLLASVIVAVFSFVDMVANSLHIATNWGLREGLFWSQSALAACWAVLGAGNLAVRRFLAAAWTTVLVLHFLPVVERWSVTHSLVTLLLIGRWQAAELAFGRRPCVVGLRLVRGAESATFKRLQFRIRDLMILTGLIALALGLRRWLALASHGEITGIADILLCRLATSSVVTLALLLALLRRGFAIRSTLTALAFALPLSKLEVIAILQIGILYPEFVWHFHLANALQAGQALLIGGILRMRGYRLAIWS